MSVSIMQQRFWHHHLVYATGAVIGAVCACGRLGFEIAESPDDGAVTGMDLEVPIEILDAPRAVPNNAGPLAQTLFTFDRDAYDGTVAYSFEVIASNDDTAPFNVDLIDTSTSTIRGTATISQTGAMNVRKRAESSTPAMPMTRSGGKPLAASAT